MTSEITAELLIHQGQYYPISLELKSSASFGINDTPLFETPINCSWCNNNLMYLTHCSKMKKNVVFCSSKDCVRLNSNLSRIPSKARFLESTGINIYDPLGYFIKEYYKAKEEIAILFKDISLPSFKQFIEDNNGNI